MKNFNPYINFALTILGSQELAEIIFIKLLYS